MLGQQGRQPVRPNEMGRADDDKTAALFLQAALDARNQLLFRSTSSR